MKLNHIKWKKVKIELKNFYKLFEIYQLLIKFLTKIIVMNLLNNLLRFSENRLDGGENIIAGAVHETFMKSAKIFFKNNSIKCFGCRYCSFI